MQYFTYILYSSSTDKFYVGYTGNINQRIEKHNLGSSRSTKAGIPWVLKYYETFDNKSDAIKRENYIKKMKSRKFIEQLING